MSYKTPSLLVLGGAHRFTSTLSSNGLIWEEDKLHELTFSFLPHSLKSVPLFCLLSVFPLWNSSHPFLLFLLSCWSSACVFFFPSFMLVVGMHGLMRHVSVRLPVFIWLCLSGKAVKTCYTAGAKTEDEQRVGGGWSWGGGGGTGFCA